MSGAPARGKYWWGVEEDLEDTDDGWTTAYVEIDIRTWESKGYYHNPTLFDPEGQPVLGCSEYSIFQERPPRPRLMLLMELLSDFEVPKS